MEQRFSEIPGEGRTLDVSDLPSGIYVVKVTTGGKIGVKKFVKMP